jgi:hypothetical protein
MTNLNAHQSMTNIPTIQNIQIHGIKIKVISLKTPKDKDENIYSKIDNSK